MCSAFVVFIRRMKPIHMIYWPFQVPILFWMEALMNC
uniref:Uncharacterized protein n=1 Tax=Anguilla anguilla TaxID=7936 RepID=A0A0E9QIW3_ANGAN